MSFATIRNFFSQNKRNILFLGAILCFFFLSYQYGFASESTPQSQNNGDLGTTFISILGGGLKIVASLLGVLTAFVALFLNPEWTSGTAFGLQNHLKEIWILVSNVVYFIFALILIVIAIMNIMNAGDKWELKQSLPRFIVGVLIVPFSWFFVQFVVSVSAILTIGVLTLPYDTFKNEDFFTNINSDFKVCVHQKIKLGNSDTNSTGDSGAAGQYLECQEEKTITDILEGSGGESGIKNGIFGIISIYTYGIMGVDGLDTISKGELNSIKALLDLGVKGIFDLVFVIVYVLLMVALFLALFTRGVWLWMYMMLSPAFGLLYFFDKTKEGMGESGKSFNVKEFLSLALVPVYVSAALSFGLVFLFVAANGINQETEREEGKETIDLVGLKLTIEGYQGKSENGLFDSAQGALSTIIVEMFGIVILWIAVMAALKTSETTGSIIKPISDFGGSVGNLVKSAPMYAPIIPMPGGGMQSAASLRTIGQQIEQVPNTAATTKGSSFVTDTLGMGGSGINLSSKSINALKALQTGQGFQDPKTWNNFRDAMSEAKSTSDLANNKSFVDLLKTMLETSGDTQAKEVGKNLTTGQPKELLKGLSILDRIGEDKYKESVVGSGTRYSEGTLLTESTLNDFLSKTSNGDLEVPETPTTVASSPINITVEGLQNPISIDKTQVFDTDGKVVESAIQPIRASLSEIDSDKIRVALTSNNSFTTEQANLLIESIKKVST